MKQDLVGTWAGSQSYLQACPRSQRLHNSKVHKIHTGATPEHVPLVARGECAAEHHSTSPAYGHFSKNWKHNLPIKLLFFSCWVLSDPRLSCPSLSPRIYSNSYPLSWWWHPTISSSITPFSSCPQSFPMSESFQWVGFSHQVSNVLAFQLQHQAFQWIFRVDFL